MHSMNIKKLNYLFTLSCLQIDLKVQIGVTMITSCWVTIFSH